MTIKDKAAVVGVGATPYYRRGQSHPETEVGLACKAILAALDDAGLTVNDLDGFALFSNGLDPAIVGAVLGMEEIRYTATITGGGGASAGALGLAASAIHSGMATCVVTCLTIQQRNRRLGGSSAGPDGRLTYAPGSILSQGFGGGATWEPIVANNGLLSPGHCCAMITRRHMHKYGTKREAFAEVAISSRINAMTHPDAIYRTPLTLDDYFNARMIADPLCLFDHTMESDGAVAVITVSADRAKDLRQRPVYIMASAHGGVGRAGPQNWKWMQWDDDALASGHSRLPAKRMWELAGIGPEDVDAAMIYDNFTPFVVMQLEDYGFAPIGEGGAFVTDGNIRWKTGKLPVNTHGGNLSGGYIIGMTHIREAVEQLRGTAANQVDGAEIVLVTGGTSLLPMSGTLLRRS